MTELLPAPRRAARPSCAGMGLLAIALGVGLGVGLPIAMFFRVRREGRGKAHGSALVARMPAPLVAEAAS